MKKRSKISHCASIDQLNTSTQSVIKNISEYYHNEYHVEEKNKIIEFVKKLENNIEFSIQRYKKYFRFYDKQSDIEEILNKKIEEDNFYKKKNQEILQECQYYNQQFKQEWQLAHKDHDLQEDKLFILEEEQRQKEQKKEEKIQELFKKSKPIEENIQWQINQQQQIKQSTLSFITKTQENLQLKKQIKKELKQNNEKLQNINDERINEKQNLSEIPYRKQMDVGIYEENLKSFNKQIKIQLDKQEEIKKKNEQVLKHVKNAENYQKQEIGLLKKYKTQYESKRQEKILNDIQYKKLLIDQNEYQYKKQEIDKELKEQFSQLRQVKTIKFMIENQLMQKKRQYKLYEKQINQIKNQLIDIKNTRYDNKIKKDELRSQINKIKNQIESTLDQEKLNILNFDDLEIKDDKEKTKIKKLQIELKFLLNQEKKLLNKEQILKEDLRQENNLRETLGKKLFSTLKDFQKMQEDTQIKELIVTDENKRKANLEKRLNHFNYLYEGVKKERNKYLNIIQQTSQEQSDLKENFKSLQREMQILKNTLIDKEGQFCKKSQELQIVINQRDKFKNKIRLFEQQKKMLLSEFSCFENNNNKFKTEITILEQRVNTVSTQNKSLESQRNNLVETLIEINKNICYFYDDFNLQKVYLIEIQKKDQNYSKTLKLILLKKEQVFIQNNLFKERMQDIPILAQKIITSKNTHNNNEQQISQLCNQLENIGELGKINQLQGQDPSEQEMIKKLTVLEAFLDQKKEIFLQKEIILEELQDLLKTFKNQAETTRCQNLKLLGKSTTFQNQLQKIVKKIMMYVSELSITQAILVRRNDEKQELETQLINIQERIDQQLPPTQQSEFNFLKIIRDEQTYIQAKTQRKKKSFREKFIYPMCIKTTAKKRPTHYINKIGLAQPFFKTGPIKPQKLFQIRKFQQNNFMEKTVDFFKQLFLLIFYFINSYYIKIKFDLIKILI